MNVRLKNKLHSNAVRVGAFFLCLLLAPVTFSARAGENSSDANSMLEGLKQRSAYDRWQRVKKQYPADAATARRNTPSQLPRDHQQILNSEELPPAPTNGPLIPRLTATPPDTSSDWVISGRNPSPEILNETESSLPNKRVASTSNLKQQPVVTDASQPAFRSKQDPAAMEADKNSKATSKTTLERTIEDIAPYYDRDRDDDIREYASERAKDFDLGNKSDVYMARSFPEITLAWEASNFYYNPLYFNDASLERYGHSHHPVIQPIASIARLGVQFVFLPYQMAINPPCRAEYALGWYRPGECTPKLCYQVPLNAQAAIVEAAAVTGVYFFIIP